ncbi:Unknown protein [Striga hermonthica]|uniref:Uncharacterized protein n=1 Tax=Striga hermonthica TaxID=68872 RepID=A0A9N7MUR6_STRHE|nr:Unknown protein [Striga hermonthica]
MATNSTKSFKAMKFIIAIMFVFALALIISCDAARLAYQGFGARLEKCGPCNTCCQPSTPACCPCACPVPP